MPRVLADAVVLVHVAFVVFVVLGGLLVLRWRWVAWVHLPAAIWGAFIECTGWVCPLTPLENWLRARAGDMGYTGGFIEHYVMPVLYPAALTASVQLGLGILVLIVNGGIYWRVVHAGRARTLRASTSPVGRRVAAAPRNGTTRYCSKQ